MQLPEGLGYRDNSVEALICKWRVRHLWRYAHQSLVNGISSIRLLWYYNGLLCSSSAV